LEDTIAFLAGVSIGLAAGLLPAMHPNTLIAILASLGFEPRALALMIIGLYPASHIMSFIPSIFFGIPERETVVSALPGQRMVMEGKGMVALKAMLFSAIIAALLSCALFAFSLEAYPVVSVAFRDWMKYILAAMSIILIARCRDPLASFALFILSGMLGWFSMGSMMEDPFLPLFSGMFAMAAIANYERSHVPEQTDEEDGGGKGEGGDGDCGKAGGALHGFQMLLFPAIGVALGMFADLMPGIGSPAQVATFATMLVKSDTLGYLAMISAISVSQALFSLATSASIDKSRVGATAWLSGLIDIRENLMLLLACFLIAISVASIAAYLLRRHAARLASVDWSVINPIIALYLAAITFVIDGPVGIAVLIVGSGIGWLAIKSGIQRTMMMGAIIIPTLLLLFRVF
jgi:putative membrane protein